MTINQLVKICTELETDEDTQIMLAFIGNIEQELSTQDIVYDLTNNELIINLQAHPR